MNKYQQRLSALTAAAIMLFGVSEQAMARPNAQQGLKSSEARRTALKAAAANCVPATAKVDLDINNVRAQLMTGGDMWWDIGAEEARYEVPKGSNKHSLFAGSVWVGGYDAQGQLKVAAQTYRQSGNDYWPGPIADNSTGGDQKTVCSDWDRFWKINKADLNRFLELQAASNYAAIEADSRFDAIRQWPATGNVDAIGVSGSPLLQGGFSTREYAPFEEDELTADGVYDWRTDRPKILGDQYIWWIFNDAGNVKGETGSGTIGLEVQASAFAFSTNDFLNDATFYNYRLINRGGLTLDSTYIATFSDADLGNAFDDYIGCDTARGLGILYNGTTVDGSGEANSYGTKIPMVGVDFFIGPKKKVTLPSGEIKEDTLKMEVFSWYNNDFTPTGNPESAEDYYGYMTGTNKSGAFMTNDFQGPGVPSTGWTPGFPRTNFVFFGNPDVKSEWSECSCSNIPYDRRFVHSSGAFRLEAGGAYNDITLGAVWVSDVGGCPNTSFRKIRAADDMAQEAFDLGFKLIEGPEAPRMTIRELDRKLVFYLTNDSSSNNFLERFGYDLSEDKYRVMSGKSKRFNDSLYKFEGYRVFQLRNSSIQPAQIFDENGEVNSDNAIEVFQSDIRNGVSRIVNYTNRRDIGDTIWQPSVKVNGKDSGIVHSFAITQDAFAKGDDKRLVNYRTYYFAAIAYAYNNFAPFSANNSENTQDIPYIGSLHGQGGTPLLAQAAMPQPSNGEIGDVLNSDYGSGVTIRRIEGSGNGGNVLQIDHESEELVFSSGTNAVAQPTYVPGLAPVNVKVVDPVLVKPVDWKLFITGPLNSDSIVVGSTGRWRLEGSDGAIYQSDTTIQFMNEQILTKYGISVQIQQTVRPGDNQPDNNGYITSDVSFADPGKTWLAGVKDGEKRSYQNWIRAGKNYDPDPGGSLPPLPCDWNDYYLVTPAGAATSANSPDTNQFYEKLLANNNFTAGTWAPYSLASQVSRNPSLCGFYIVKAGTRQHINRLHSIDVVFTSDKSKWTRCVVVEENDNASLAQGKTERFRKRSHASWNGDLDANGNPVYSTTPGDTGMSYFPGYAINQETGERLNIVFGEDSYMAMENGRDMLWNPTSTTLNDMGEPVFGGRHYIYISDRKYDEGEYYKKTFAGSLIQFNTAWTSFGWVGVPLVNPAYKLTSLKDGLIPTETRLRFRVTRPYAKYVPDTNATLVNNGLPYYTFTTKNLAPTKYGDRVNVDKDAMLDNIRVVPNPYYAYAGYEQSRLDTRVRITNLPRRATINVYALDGTLVRRLKKDDVNRSYIDWDLRNMKGMPIASGMYLFHVNADGIGETVIRWFGAMRPVDITNY